MKEITNKISYMHIFAFHTYSYNDRVEGAKPHTLQNQIFLKEITNEIRKKHKLAFHTREYHDGVGGGNRILRISNHS